MEKQSKGFFGFGKKEEPRLDDEDPIDIEGEPALLNIRQLASLGIKITKSSSDDEDDEPSSSSGSGSSKQAVKPGGGCKLITASELLSTAMKGKDTKGVTSGAGSDSSIKPSSIPDVKTLPVVQGVSSPAVTSPLDKLHQLDPQDLADDEFEWAGVNQLELKPFLKKSDIDSPLEILAPDELVDAIECKSTCLEIDTIIKDSYQVDRIVRESTRCNVYQVTDVRSPDSSKKYALMELIPDPMPEDELKKRRKKVEDLVHGISSAKHPNLAEVYNFFTEDEKDYVVLEWVEGVDLKKLSDMNTKPFSEKETISWGNVLCETIEHLHYRPEPFVLGELDPSQVVLSFQGTLKIVYFDFQQYYNIGKKLEYRPDDPTKLYTEISNLAKLLFLLLTKKLYEMDTPVEWPDNVSKKLRKFLQVSCNDRQQSIGDIKVFKAKLNETQLVESEKEYLRRTYNFPIHQISFAFLKKAYTAVLSQRTEFLALEGVLLLFILLLPVLFKLTEKRYVRPTGSVLYVATMSELHVMDPVKLKDLHRVPVSGQVSTVFPMKLKIYNARKDRKELRDVLLVSYQGIENIDVFDTRTMSKVASIPSSSDAEKMFVEPGGKLLFMLHPKLGIVTAIKLEELTVERMFPTGNNPVDMVYIPFEEGDRDRFPGLPPPPSHVNKSGQRIYRPFPVYERRFTPKFYFADEKSRRVQSFDLDTGKMNAEHIMKGVPSALAVSRDRTKLYVADSALNQVIVLNPMTMAVTDTIPVSGEKPSAMILDDVENILYVTTRDDNQLIRVNPTTKETKSLRNVGLMPYRMYYDKNSFKLWVLSSRSKDVTVVDLKSFTVQDREKLDGTPTSVVLESF